MTITWRSAFLVWSSLIAIGVAGLAVSAPPESAGPTIMESRSITCHPEPAPVHPLLVLFQGKNEVQPSMQRPYLGFRSCLQCHNSGIEGGEVEGPGGIKISLMKEQWVLYKEFPIWAKDDKHGQAYTVLLNERSRNMGKLLGVSEIHRDQRCLACHTGFPIAQMPIEKNGLVAADLTKNLDINLGVSCEGCHGPAGDLKADNKTVLAGWIDAHKQAPTLPYEKTRPWRFLAPKDKHDNHGFFDVRSPAAKAKLCVSCHIGDVEQGRIVTHEMYAAGHPPLPGFEIETFVTQLPKHWAEFGSKSAEVQDLFLKYSNDPLYKDGAHQKKSLHRTRSLLAGALMASGEYLRYAGQLADQDVKSLVKRPDWPELAVFDCYACHHELKSPGWRQMRRPPVGVPGRPTMQEWPFILAKLALKTLGDQDADAKLADVRKALNAQPFGQAREFAKPAQTAAAWYHARAAEMERKQLTKEEGITLLKEIARVGATEPIDYDSARQLVWAFQVIAGDLKSDYPSAKKIEAALEPMGKEMFLLDLRKGRQSATAVPGDKQERKTVEVDLDVVLPFLSRYEPAKMRDRFRAIGEMLK